MAKEIERKFLIKNENWKKYVTKKIKIKQGYIINNKKQTIRIRITNNNSFLTIKGPSDKKGISRNEFEFPIPQKDALEIFKEFCLPGKINKTRNEIKQGKHKWEIDVFEGENKGLVVAEIELSSENEKVENPDWIGKEVTKFKKYTNARLSKKPYSKWNSI